MVHSPSNIRRLPRPLSVTLLALGVLTVASLNLLRLVEVIRQWAFLVERLTISPLYLAWSGAVWGLMGLSLAWGLWRGLRQAPRLVVLFALAYSIYSWIDRLWVATEGAANRPFAVGVNVLLLACMFWILTRPKARAFFGDLHEHRNQNRTSARPESQNPPGGWGGTH